MSSAATPPDAPLADEVSRALVDVIVREQPGAGNSRVLNLRLPAFSPG